MSAYGERVDWSRPATVARLRGRSIGFVFQLPVLDESATARENVLDGVRLARRLIDAAMSDRVERLADEVGIAQLLDRRVDALSGGEKQRLSVLRAMIKQPSLIVADEPTASVDAIAREQILAVLHRAVAMGAAVVVVTHERDIAAGPGVHLELSDGRLRPLSRRGN